jgi:methyl-accepting chemotaxis protein
VFGVQSFLDLWEEVYMQWFRNLKTSHKILGLVGIMVCFIAFIGFIGQNYTAIMAKSSDALYNDMLIPIQQIELFRVHTNANRANVLEIILQSDKAKQQEYVAEIAKRGEEANKLIADYEKTNLDNKEKGLLQTLKDSLVSYRDARTKIVELALAGQKDEAFREFQANGSKFKDIVSAVEELSNYKDEEAKKVDAQNAQDAANVQNIIIVSLVVVIGIAISLGLMISSMIAKPINEVLEKVSEVAKGNLAVERIKVKSTDEVGQCAKAFNAMTDSLQNLVKEVIRSVDEVSSGSEEVSAAADQTAQGAQQVASSVSQLAAGSQEQAKNVNLSVKDLTDMNVVIQKIYQNSENVVKLSKSATANATSGGQQADKAIKKVNDIKHTSQETSKTINELGELSLNIGRIVDLIKNIAAQTNLLALNAAIEAARAGEHGRGFAVVAEEVKKLAEQSGTASDQITGMIKEIQGKTGTAVRAMEDGTKEIEEGVLIIETVGNALKEIVGASAQVTDQSAEVSNVADNLVKSSDNVVRMMENVSAITEESAAAAEEISSVTEEQTASLEEINATSQAVAKVAENLQNQIAAFTV